MKTTPVAALAVALGLSLMLAGCGKKMADTKFANVATSIYNAINDNWDHQPGEKWVTYYERRITEACSKYGADVAEWDKKIRDVKDHPEEFEKVLDKEILADIIEWEAKREAAHEQDS